MKRVARSNWERALLVCAKCSRKLGGGFGPKGRTPLAKALRRELGVGKGRKAKIGVAEVKCLGVCPKHAVTIIDTADLSRWRLVPPGLDGEEVARLLLADPADATSAAQLVPASSRVESAPVPPPGCDQPPAA